MKLGTVTSWSNRDEAFHCVAVGIRETVEELWKRRAQKLENQIHEFDSQFEQAEARKQQAKNLKIDFENELANPEAKKQQMDRWKILEETQAKIFEIQQDITVNKAKAANKMYNKWDEYIRSSPPQGVYCRVECPGGFIRPISRPPWPAS